MEDQNLELLKRLILQRPASNHLLRGEVDSSGFKECSQLSEVPDRNKWWEEVRTITGFLVLCIRDLYIRDAEFRELTNRMVEHMRQADIKPVVQEEVVEIVAEEAEPPSYVPGSTWDPFKE